MTDEEREARISYYTAVGIPRDEAEWAVDKPHQYIVYLWRKTQEKK